MTPSQNESVLIVGSGPNAVDCANWQGFDRILTINNAWRVRDDWDYLICPEDFPQARRPAAVRPDQHLIEATQFVPAQNAFGGFVYAGATMAFTAGYWALHALRPKVLAFIGCDMVYPAKGPTHFYGTGAPDPLREDISLLDLGASSARLALMGAAQGTRCVNLSRDDSVLMFERSEVPVLPELSPPQLPCPDAYQRALAYEDRLGYFVQSGRIWESRQHFDAEALRHLHALWRSAFAGKETKQSAA